VRALEPSLSGVAVRDGVRIAYDVYGSGERTLLLLPAWSICHSRLWKAQVPYLARHARVVTFDGRGNGRSDRSPSLDYSDEAFAADALAVMDSTGTTRATLIGLSAGARWALMVAARHPERVEQLICLGPAVPLAPPNAGRAAATFAFETKLDAYDGWAKYNRYYWTEHYRDFVEFFFSEALPEAHSTKPFEDAVEWALETTPETLAATVVASQLSEEEARELAARVRCPVLVMHGSADRIVPCERGRALAEATHGRFVLLDGSGHLPQGRVPVRVNAEIRDALGPRPSPKPRTGRRKRALFISSPIGLGHAQRDVAIAAELRSLRDDVEIEWLAQDPVTATLRARGETIHPASAALANETAHLESECAEHDLHAFRAIRRMDEILVNNFMVFYDLIREEHFDLVVGDEAWDVDHYLHEHPNEKRTAFVWMTDFVGWLPMPDGGDYEQRITADYNAEMIEHIERSPKLRDRSIFVGEPEDIVSASFGPGLPAIREWTEAHYDFPGYVTGFVPPTEDEREELRERFGYRPDEKICIVTVGGSGVGAALLRRIIGAYPEAKRRLPELRMIVVAGPRIDPATLPSHPGLELRGYVPELYRHLSVCDVALVQGGLTTTMELTAAERPFVYFPLGHHFEQTYHVSHRLERYRAGRRMDYARAGFDEVAEAIVLELGRKPVYRPVQSDGAAKAAALIAEVL
jgi:pimeloyl-ACP methyl ester carboxylesterase